MKWISQHPGEGIPAIYTNHIFGNLMSDISWLKLASNAVLQTMATLYLCLKKKNKTKRNEKKNEKVERRNESAANPLSAVGQYTNYFLPVLSTGVHYHYNISVDLDCYKSLPVFLLFSPKTKSLIGFGWGGPVDVTSNAWEKPDPSLFAVSA